MMSRPEPWLLQAGDPLPALPLADERWTTERFAGYWSIIAVAMAAVALPATAGVRTLAVRSPASQGGPFPGWRDDCGTLSALRLGALVGPHEVVSVAVLLDPAGTVVHAVAGADIAALVAGLIAEVPAAALAAGQPKPSTSR